MEELPILIAALPEEQARALEEASRVGQDVAIELKWSPVQQGPHLLEVYTPSSNVPLRLLAEPLSVASPEGTALRVYPWEERQPELAAPSSLNVMPDDLVGRSLAGGRFEIVSLIGDGSIGAVYRGRHTGLAIDVAVKVLHEAFQRDAEFCQRFYDEALALSRLDHPNLVHIYDFGQEPDGLLYIAMAVVDGITLRTIMHREKQLPLDRIVALMLQVCAGLGHAHSRGLIHRDVKPDNVMIVTRENDDGDRVETVKLLDFGFAVPPDVSGEVAQRLAGTPVYMSPEQCFGEELDARSDVYACGIMLYELATGTVPFVARDASSIHQMQISKPPPLVASLRPDIDPRFDRLVQKALAKSRDERHSGMKELRAELKSLLFPEGVPRLTGEFDRASRPSIRQSQAPPSQSEPDALAPHAMRVLTERDPAAAEIIGAAHVAGAYALYNARAKMVAEPEARVAFVTTMKALGEAALPVVRAALERVLPQAAVHPAATDLAEDVLLAVPPIPDEATGHLVVQYARSPIAHLCRAAARALPRVWGERAAPVLLHLLGYENDDVRIAAILGLREIGCVDHVVVARLASLVDSGRASGHELRLAIATALEAAPGPDAAVLLAQLSRGKG